MSEFVSKPTSANQDLDELRWASTATPGSDIVQPAGAKRDTGWSASEVPPRETFNWFWNVVGLALQWLSAWYIRAFSNLESALGDEDVTQGKVFLRGQTSDPNPMGAVEWSKASATNMLSCCADGEAIFVTDLQTVLRLNRSTGATLATSAALGTNVRELACDGKAVYAGLTAGATSEFHILDPSDMTTLSAIVVSSTPNIEAVAGNGEHFGHTQGLSGANFAYVYQWTGATTWSSVGNVDHGGALYAMAMDWNQVYVGGANGTGNVHIRGYDLATLTLQWSYAISFISGTPVVRDITTDGDYVYLTGDRVNTSGSMRAVWCLARLDGSLVWAADTQDTADGASCAVDQRYLWVLDEAGKLHCYDKRTGDLLHTVAGATGNAANSGLDVDGEAVYVSGDVSSGDAAHRISAGRHTQLFQRANPSDPTRRPFAKLALPLS